MTIKINAKLVRASEFEAVILTDEPLPLSEIHQIQKRNQSLLLISDEGMFEVNGELTGLESVYLWSSGQNGKIALDEPKPLEWAA